MSNKLGALAGMIPTSSAGLRKGVIVKDPDAGNALAVNLDGEIVPVAWADPMTIFEGDVVLVAILRSVRGQSEAVAVTRVTDVLRPNIGTVSSVPPGSDRISVIGSDGVTYSAYFVASYVPAVNDKVFMIWSGGVPVIYGEGGATMSEYTPPAPPPVPPPPVVPPPPKLITGSNTYAAANSGTYTPALSGWDRWRGGGGYVHQGGSAYGAANSGAWFYHGAPKALAGRTITRIQFTLGSRLTVGAYNSPVVVHLYRHGNPTKPAGDVSRIQGPHNVTIPAGAGQRTFDLPLSWAAGILAGGGIGIYGEQYAGFHGRGTQPSSGLLKLYWKRYA